MKNSFLLLFFAVLGTAMSHGQNRLLHGNGMEKTALTSLVDFHELIIDLRANVTIHNGGMPKMSIRCDANLMKAISAEVTDQKLLIRVKPGYWIESGSIDITLWVPFLTHLETRGTQTDIGTIEVTTIDTEVFTCKVLAGKVILQGQTNRLFVSSSNHSNQFISGTIDASGLEAQWVDADIRGSNSARVYAVQALHVRLQDQATLKFSGYPSLITKRGKALQTSPDEFGVEPDLTSSESDVLHDASQGSSLSYVTFKVRNNSLRRQNFLIKGPTENGRGFSYGFPMMPFATRSETIPVGTKIFPESGLHLKPLLIVKAEDAGTVIDIFNPAQQ